MIRRDKDKKFYVNCSVCKTCSKKAGDTEESALGNAEYLDGFAVSGKFHFCPSCFSEMLERWKAVNKGVLDNVG